MKKTILFICMTALTTTLLTGCAATDKISSIFNKDKDAEEEVTETETNQEVTIGDLTFEIPDNFEKRKDDGGFLMFGRSDEEINAEKILDKNLGEKEEGYSYGDEYDAIKDLYDGFGGDSKLEEAKVDGEKALVTRKEYGLNSEKITEFNILTFYKNSLYTVYGNVYDDDNGTFVNDLVKSMHLKGSDPLKTEEIAEDNEKETDIPEQQIAFGEMTFTMPEGFAKNEAAVQQDDQHVAETYSDGTNIVTLSIYYETEAVDDETWKANIVSSQMAADEAVLNSGDTSQTITYISEYQNTVIGESPAIINTRTILNAGSEQEYTQTLMLIHHNCKTYGVTVLTTTDNTAIADRIMNTIKFTL